MTKTYSKTRILVEGALMIALSTVLSMIQIPLMPHGGSITLFSMVPILVMSYRHGAKWGIMTAFVNSLIQLVQGLGNLAYCQTLTAQVGCVLLDYLLAFTVLGFACLIAKPFRSRTVGVGVSAFVVCLLRFFVQLSVRLHRLEGLRLRFQLDDRNRLSRHLQHERGRSVLAVQCRVQRHLHAARSHSDHGPCGDPDPCRTADLRPAERKSVSFFRSHFFPPGRAFPRREFFLQKIPKKLLTIRQSAGIITSVVRHGTNIWGISSAGRRLHGMQEVTGSIPVFSTRRKSTARKRVVFFVITDQRRNYELRDRIQQ